MADDLTVPEVVVDLSGEIFTLRADLGPAININAAFGGIYRAGQQSMAGDIAAIATIIRYGAQLDAKAEKDLIGKVFRAGVNNVAPLTTSFITILMNGGNLEAPDTGEAKPSDQSGG